MHVTNFHFYNTKNYLYSKPAKGLRCYEVGYCFAFNGKENDDETKTQDYGMRIYDNRLGRFLSVDPIEADYPELSTYQFTNNNPIWAIDLDGLEARISIAGKGTDSYKPSDIVSFHKRAMSIKVKYGFNYAGKVNSGQALLKVFKNYTKEQGSILRVVTFSHGSDGGLILDENQGFYRFDVSYGGEQEKEVKHLAEDVKSGKIKFAKDAIWIMWSCNSASESNTPTLSSDVTLKTGLTTIAATGSVFPEILNGKETGRMETTGTFLKTEKIFNLNYEIDGKTMVKSFSSKSMAESYNKGFNSDNAYKYTLTEDVKKTNIGSVIDPGKQ